MVKRALIALILLLLLTPLLGCSTGYVIRAAYEEGQILWRRENIKELLNSGAVQGEEAEKLAVVLEARAFSETIGLTPNDAYTQYSKIDRDVLAWVVMCARKTSFELKTWWFPIVGTVPYRGYFEKADALKFTEKLSAKGYECSVRPTEAFSTLGWFNDPILSTTLRRDQISIANTVIHEIVHGTVWVKNHVAFNESLANFVAHEAAVQFWNSPGRTALSLKQSDQFSESPMNKAEEERVIEYELAILIQTLYSALDELYRSDGTDEVKLARRAEIFDSATKEFRERHPNAKILRTISNAEIMQLKLYLTKLNKFAEAFNRLDRDWLRFFALIQEISKKARDSKHFDPFAALDGIN